MNHLIIYSSKYGAVEKCAKLIQERLDGTTQLINLKTDSVNDFEAYDTVLIGGSVYAGKFQEALRKFATDHQDGLCKKKLGIFLLCKDEGEKVQEYMESNLPKCIVDHAQVKVHLGHEINLEKMNFLEKTLLKTFFKIKKSYSQINQDAISELANTINAK